MQKKPVQPPPVTINPDLIVADVLDHWPEVIPLFLKYRMSCVGCAMAGFETLSDALQIYHLSAEQFLDELANLIQAKCS